jgi:plastocyanin
MIKKLSLLVVSALIFTACSDAKNSLTSPAVDSDTNQVQDKAVTKAIEMSNFKFSQDTILVKPGQTVTIELENVDGFHDFIIDELNVASEQISMGQSTQVTFKIPENASGNSYSFYCSVGTHRQLGMEGTLVVE